MIIPEGLKGIVDKLRRHIVGSDIPSIVDSVITDLERRIKDLKRDIELASKAK